MNNRRNRFGVKDSIDQYRTIEGRIYKTWIAGQSKENALAIIKEETPKYPRYHFILRKISGTYSVLETNMWTGKGGEK